MESCVPVSNYKRLLANNVVLTEVLNGMFGVSGMLLKKTDHCFDTVLIIYTCSNWRTAHFVGAYEMQPMFSGYTLYGFNLKWPITARHMTFLIAYTFEGRIRYEDNGGDFYKLRRGKCQFVDIQRRYRDVRRKDGYIKYGLKHLLDLQFEEEKSIDVEQEGSHDRSQDNLSAVDSNVQDLVGSPSKRRKLDVDPTWPDDNSWLDYGDSDLESSSSESKASDTSSVSTFDSDIDTCSIITDELSLDLSQSMDEYEPIQKPRYYFRLSILPKEGQNFLQQCLDSNAPCFESQSLQNFHQHPDESLLQPTEVTTGEMCFYETCDGREKEDLENQPQLEENYRPVVEYFLNGILNKICRDGENFNVDYYDDAKLPQPIESSTPREIDEMSRLSAACAVCSNHIDNENDLRQVEITVTDSATDISLTPYAGGSEHTVVSVNNQLDWMEPVPNKSPKIKRLSLKKILSFISRPFRKFTKCFK